MTDRDIQEFYSADRMVGIMTANNEIFKINAKAMSLKVSLINDIEILETEGAARVSASGMRADGTIDKQAAESNLEKFVRKIASDAKTIKKAEPDFDNKFVLRRGSFNNQTLLDTARAFQTDLTTAAVAKFSEYGNNNATPAKIQAKIDAFEAGRDQQNAGKGGGIAATAETKAAIKRLKANRRTLKTIGENILDEHGDAGLVAEWKSACKIERKRSAPAPPATPPNP